ncbi:hypothetical protein RIF29_04633 [Crotalaria pallida]|uniref:Uncharacterized protein n=1 Tax=Crotalaria pallida TaxID=3830 RepID=A0AAN9PA57_CROPI
MLFEFLCYLVTCFTFTSIYSSSFRMWQRVPGPLFVALKWLRSVFFSFHHPPFSLSLSLSLDSLVWYRSDSFLFNTILPPLSLPLTLKFQT